jgi:hypothetical protein
MVLENSMEAPQDLKQVPNFKQESAKLQWVPTTNRKNTADDVQTLINMMKDNLYIQEHYIALMLLIVQLHIVGM